MPLSEVQERVRARYREAALQVADGDSACCGKVNCCAEGASASAAESAVQAGREPRGAGKASCCGNGEALAWDPITADLYDAAETADLPMAAVLASLGCGNPTALAELQEGETVLDLGSGGGIDVLLSARRVGPSGRAFGLDMTDEMLALAQDNQRKSGLTNAVFLRGTIEAIPLPSDSVDVVISNCVINLSADKSAVLREAYRVLRPGGRFAVSDLVLRGALGGTLASSADLWCGCVSGALGEDEYVRLLSEAGFTGVSLEPTRVYGEDEMRALATAAGAAEVHTLAGSLMSAFVRATKPAER
ncbi:MAG: arsenite methyltransferase [Gemmatimonadaceae bacterium]